MFKRVSLVAQFFLPLLIHAAVVSGSSRAVAAVLALVSFLWGRIFSESEGIAARVANGALCWVMPGCLLWWHASVGVEAVLLGYPILIYLGLSWVFASTLRAGREPLITLIARLERGRLSPEIADYTRRLTLLWTAFFLGLAAESALLGTFAPVEVWSLFVNVLNDALMLLVFAGEYTYRRLRFHREQHTNPLHLARRIMRERVIASRGSSLP